MNRAQEKHMHKNSTGRHENNNVYDDEETNVQEATGEYYYENEQDSTLNVPRDQEYYYEHDMQAENISSQYDDIMPSFDALEKLSLQQEDRLAEIKDLEVTEQNINDSLIQANKFIKEEANLLNENLAGLTFKSENNNRRKRVYQERIVKKRDYVMSDIVQMLDQVTEYKEIHAQTKQIQKEFRKKATDTLAEKAKQVEQELNKKRIDIEKVQNYGETKIKNMEVWLAGIKTFHGELTTLNNTEHANEKDIHDMENQLDQIEQKTNSIDLNQLENDNNTIENDIAVQNESIKYEEKEIDEMGKVIEAEIAQLHQEQQDNTNKNGLINQQYEEAEIQKKHSFESIQNNTLEMNKLHMESLNLQREIYNDSKNFELVAIKKDGLLKSIEETGVIAFEFDKNLNGLDQEQQKTREMIDTLDNNMKELNEHYQLLNKQIEKHQKINTENKSLEIKQIRGNKMNECFENIKILEQQLNEVESKSNEVIRAAKATEQEIQSEIVDKNEENRQERAHFDNLAIDVQNNECVITHIEEEMINYKKTHATHTVDLDEQLQTITENNEKLEENHKETIRKVETEIEEVNNINGQLKANMNKDKNETKILGESARKQIEVSESIETAVSDKVNMITNLEQELKDIQQTKKETNEGVTALENELKSLRLELKLEEEMLNTEREHKVSNTNACKQVQQRIEILKQQYEEKITIVNNKAKLIQDQTDAHETEKAKALREFELEQASKLDSLGKHKKSFLNKIKIHSANDEELAQSYEVKKNQNKSLQEEVNKLTIKKEEYTVKVANKSSQCGKNQKNFEQVLKLIKKSE